MLKQKHVIKNIHQFSPEKVQEIIANLPSDFGFSKRYTIDVPNKKSKIFYFKQHLIRIYSVTPLEITILLELNDYKKQNFYNSFFVLIWGIVLSYYIGKILVFVIIFFFSIFILYIAFKSPEYTEKWIKKEINIMTNALNKAQ